MQSWVHTITRTREPKMYRFVKGLARYPVTGVGCQGLVHDGRRWSFCSHGSAPDARHLSPDTSRLRFDDLRLEAIEEVENLVGFLSWNLEVGQRGGGVVHEHLPVALADVHPVVG